MPNNRLRQFVRRYPVLRGPLRSMYRSGQYVSARALGKLRRDKLALIYVDPRRIQMTVNQDDPTLRDNQVWHIGTIADGDWDLGGVPVRDHGQVYEILAAHVEAKQPFGDIPQFQANCRRIEHGLLVDSCTTPAEYYSRWRDITALYAIIQRDGYKTQVELGSDNPLDEIRVQIGRQGEILFEEGLHRLVIAHMLDLPAVPVLVTRRHKDWATLREAVQKIVLQRGFIHQPFDHPDLDSLATLYGNDLADRAFYAHDRWEFISQSLPIAAGSVLDIGAYFGYFDHRLEDLGFDCYAVEPDRENLVVLNFYRTMHGRRFIVWPHSIFEIDKFDFDVVLALNIFHHLVRSKTDFLHLEAFLRRLRCQAIYFEPDENVGVDSFRHFSNDEFVSFVRTHTGLTHVRWLGRAKEGRPVYLLT